MIEGLEAGTGTRYASQDRDGLRTGLASRVLPVYGLMICDRRGAPEDHQARAEPIPSHRRVHLHRRFCQLHST